MEYNPYDLLRLKINGTPIDGRPIEFDGTSGDSIKPTKLSTVCPDCGQGLEFELELPEPPFPIIEQNCYHCNNVPMDIPDPFINPLESGRIASHELDPLMHDPQKQVVETNDVVGNKALAMQVEGDTEMPPDALDEEEAEDANILTESQEEPEETPRRVFEQRPVTVQSLDGPIVPLEQAEGMGQEEDFDLDDLVEDE